ncbi:DYTN protein, partial [Nothocercus nigrocapillus]|nr:DYTN protein [Nothocercus nigrocapillus]
MCHFFEMLKELFQRVRLEKPGQVDPRAAEFILSLLTAMCDRSGTGYIKTQSAAAALIALSGDSLLVKCRGGKDIIFFKLPKRLNVEKSHNVSETFFLLQITGIVGESCVLSSVEIATQSCFHEVLNSAIVEEKFQSWLRSEPALLLWFPTCYRLFATKIVSHQVRYS